MLAHLKTKLWIMCAEKKTGLNLLAGQRDKLKDPFPGNFSRKFRPHWLISQGKEGLVLPCVNDIILVNICDNFRFEKNVFGLIVVGEWIYGINMQIHFYGGRELFTCLGM